MNKEHPGVLYRKHFFHINTLYLHGLIELLYHLHFFKTDLRSLWVGKISFEEHIMLMDHWELMQPKVKYFPEALNAPDVQARLQKLKELS